MSRIVSINQAEPGLYVVSIQRSRNTPIETLMRSIANPPLDESVQRAARAAADTHMTQIVSGEGVARGGAARRLGR